MTLTEIVCSVRGGSAAEEQPGGRGIAHLAEHLVATAAAAEMERSGTAALLNAFTSREATSFRWSVAAEDVSTSLRCFQDAVQRVTLDPAGLEAEKKVVLREIEQSHDRLARGEEPPVCGYPSLVRDVTTHDVRAYMTRIYQTGNMSVRTTAAKPPLSNGAHILVRGGVFAGPACSLMARLLTRNAPETYYSFCDENFVGLSGDDPGTLRALALQPTFAGFEEEKAKPLRLRPMRALQMELKKALYQTHPYRLCESETPDTITLDDVVACHRRLFVTSELEPHLEERGQPQSFAVEKPWPFGALAIGFRGIPFDEESWPALELVKALLVGPSNNSVRGRFTRAMREDGVAYTVTGLNQAGFGEGYFALLAAIAPDREAEAIDVAAREIERLRDGEVGRDEFEHCRKLYLLDARKRAEEPRAQAYATGTLRLFGADPARVEARLRTLNITDIVAAAAHAFRESTKSMVVVRPQGDPS
ncbi:MAG TPA: insulinase family protein [Thermoanaerobaculia bacterium]